jgi:hypothetical protein
MQISNKSKFRTSDDINRLAYGPDYNRNGFAWKGWGAAWLRNFAFQSLKLLQQVIENVWYTIRSPSTNGKGRFEP